MKRGWTTTKLIVAASLGALNLIINLSGATLTTVTGIIVLSGLINLFTTAFFVPLTSLIVKRFGSVTIF